MAAKVTANDTYRLTAKKPGSALCPMLVIDYGTILLYFTLHLTDTETFNYWHISHPLLCVRQTDSSSVVSILNYQVDSLRWFSQRRSPLPHFWGCTPRGAMTPHSNSAEIFVPCTYPQVSSCLLIRKLSCWQTHKQMRWKHPTVIAVLRRLIKTSIVTTTQWQTCYYHSKAVSHLDIWSQYNQHHTRRPLDNCSHTTSSLSVARNDCLHLTDPDDLQVDNIDIIIIVTSLTPNSSSFTDKSQSIEPTIKYKKCLV